MKSDLECPFRVGDEVVYQPSPRGRGLIIMESEQLKPGTTYRVSGIQQERYVVVEGYESPAGGIYWTEFVRAG